MGDGGGGRVRSAGPHVRRLKFKCQGCWITKSFDCNDDDSDCHSLDHLLLSDSALNTSHLTLTVTPLPTLRR